ncbi:MAG: hypothetical protein ACI33S_01950 [Bacilli bacterium]
MDSEHNNLKNNELQDVNEVIKTLILIKDNLENKVKEETCSYENSKLICSISTAAFLVSNTLVIILAPQAIGISVFLSTILFGSLSLNEFIESHSRKRIIKNLKNKIKFFDSQLDEAYLKSEELKCNIKEKRYKIEKIYKKEELFSEYNKHQKRFMKLYKNNALTNYLLKKGYSSDEVELFYEIIEEDLIQKVREANEKIAEKHYSLNKKSNDNIGLYY